MTGFPKGTKLGPRKRDKHGKCINKDGTPSDYYKPNNGHWLKGKRNSPSTEFKPGQEPHNKGKKWSSYMSERSQREARKRLFKPGNVPESAHKKGTVKRLVSTHKKSGKPEVYYVINIDWKGRRRHHNSYKWYLWEKEHQQDRPKGMVLAMKDGNPDNIRVDNLEIISRAENLRRNRGR